jgi:peptidoglycan/LPS O-acetylase OafA/YrhL
VASNPEAVRLLGPIRHAAPEILFQTFVYTALSLLFGALLVLAAAKPHDYIAHFLQQNWLRSFGLYSYAMYLFNVPVRLLCGSFCWRHLSGLTVFPSQLPGQIIMYVVETVAVFAAAFASWHVYEKHFLRLKTLFPDSGCRNVELIGSNCAAQTSTVEANAWLNAKQAQRDTDAQSQFKLLLMNWNTCA